jgi:hypothetical protein
MTPARLIILLFAFSIIACEKNNENEAAINDQLIGSWFNPQYNDSIVTFERSEGSIDNEYGFTFNEDNTFIESKNVGWCGTPPISYADFDGKLPLDTGEAFQNIHGKWFLSMKHP